MKKSILFALSAALFLLPASVGAVDYNWGTLLKNNDAWFAGVEARAIADSIVKYQLANGGWRKAMDDVTQTGEWAKSTTDNDATTSQIIFLARIYKGSNTAKYLTSCQKGIDLLITGQYANGGWPQVFGASASAYNRHITFNDGAMVRVLEIIKAVSERSGHFTFIDNTRASQAKTAMEKGVDCILKSQIVFTNGVKTAWCQQHDMNTLAPVGARAYELPSVSGSESVGIVDFLKSYHASLGNNPRLDVVRAINAAVTWMTSSRIVGYRVENITTNGEADRRLVASSNSDTLWARFYELNTNRPMFVGRDGIVKYSMAEIEQERRAGYAWYGTWPRGLVRAGLLAEPSTNRPPVASVTAPANNAVFMPGQAINITATASDPDGSVTRVEFFNGATKLGERTAAPYTFAWANPPAGVHTITARATDNANATGTSAAVTVITGAYIGAQSLIDSLIMFDPANAAAWSVKQNFSAGSKIFGDREFVSGAIPAILQGAEWISTSMETRRLTSPATIAQFKTKKAVNVRLLHEDRITAKPAWIASGGFTSTGQKVTVNDGTADRTFTVYTKSASQSATVTLGINSSDGLTSSLMYMAAVTDAATTQTAFKPNTIESTRIAVKGKKLNISAASNTNLQIRIFDIKGKTVTRFNTTGSGNLSLSQLPSGRYLAETREHGGLVSRFAFVLD